jgi:hypothetical protein
MSEFPEIDYTSRDYQSFKTDLLNLMASHLTEWTNITEDDFGVMLTELFCHLADSLAYYQDRQANEAFLPTAILRRNVINLCRLVNYELRNASPATATVQFTCNAAGTIPSRTQVATTSTDLLPQIIFEVDEDVTVAGAGVVNVAVTQGVTFADEVIGVSDGTINQEMKLENNPYVEGSIEVYVDEGSGYVLWTPATDNDLLNHSGSEKVYAISVDENDILTVFFGDAINGKIPILNAPVKSTYRVGGGLIGNVGAGTIVNLINTLTFVDSITNASSATGGEDKETIEEARVSAPASIYTLRRGVTERDFITLAEAYPGIVRARCIGIAALPAKAHIWVIPTGGGQPSQSLLTNLTSYLTERRMLGLEVTCFGPYYAYVDIIATVQVDNAYKQSTIQSSVEAGLSSYFEISADVGARTFGDVVPIGDIYNIIESVEGVKYTNITKLNIQPIAKLTVPSYSFDSRIFRLGVITETITVVDLDGTNYSVNGSISGAQSNGQFGAAYEMDAGSNRNLIGWTLNTVNNRAGDTWVLTISTVEILYIDYNPVLSYLFSNYVLSVGCVAETWTITDIGGGNFSVTGNISGAQTGGTYGVAWLADAGANSGLVGFTLAVIGNILGDQWTLKNSAYVGNITLENDEFALKGTIGITYFGGY